MASIRDSFTSLFLAVLFSLHFLNTSDQISVTAQLHEQTFEKKNGDLPYELPLTCLESSERMVGIGIRANRVTERAKEDKNKTSDQRTIPSHCNKAIYREFLVLAILHLM